MRSVIGTDFMAANLLKYGDLGNLAPKRPFAASSVFLHEISCHCVKIFIHLTPGIEMRAFEPSFIPKRAALMPVLL